MIEIYFITICLSFILAFCLGILISDVLLVNFPHGVSSQLKSWNHEILIGKQIQWKRWSLPDFSGQFVIDPVVLHLLHSHRGAARSQHQQSSHLQQQHCIIGCWGNFILTGHATFYLQVSSTPVSLSILIQVFFTVPPWKWLRGLGINWKTLLSPDSILHPDVVLLVKGDDGEEERTVHTSQIPLDSVEPGLWPHDAGLKRDGEG